MNIFLQMPYLLSDDKSSLSLEASFMDAHLRGLLTRSFFSCKEHELRKKKIGSPLPSRNSNFEKKFETVSSDPWSQKWFWIHYTLRGKKINFYIWHGQDKPEFDSLVLSQGSEVGLYLADATKLFLGALKKSTHLKKYIKQWQELSSLQELNVDLSIVCDLNNQKFGSSELQNNP